MQLSEKIAYFRKQRGLTQQQLADLLYVSDKAVSKWETGRGNPEISMLPRLAAVLGTTVDDLLSAYQPTASVDPITDPLPPMPSEKVWVLDKTRWLFFMLMTGFIPTGLNFFVALILMTTGYNNAVTTALVLILLNTMIYALAAGALFISFKNPKGLIMYGVFQMAWPLISFALADGSNASEGGIWLMLLKGLVMITTGILIVLFSLRKIKSPVAIIVLMWVTVGFNTLGLFFTAEYSQSIEVLSSLVNYVIAILITIGYQAAFKDFREIEKSALSSSRRFA